MKTSRGLTLLEVITALAITAILLPVVSLVFYNMLTTPPGQTARLALNNEVSLLSYWLYNDVHRADSFTVGDGDPYYGNFTWTDYNQLNPEGGYNDYLISYYATCPGPEDPECTNSIVRQVILTNGSVAWPTPTSTSGPTATPTPEPTEVPTTQTYTYCSGGGSDKWAWARAWTNTEWVTQGHPTAPDDFFEDYDRDIESAGTSDFSLICAADNASWSEPDTASPADYSVSSQLYMIKVYQDDVTDLDVTWRGYGGASTKNASLEIWNYTDNAWETLISESAPDSKINDTYTYGISSAWSEYIEAGTGYLTMLVSAEDDEIMPPDTDFGTALYFNGSAHNSMTTNSTVPTDTFTFEAWVRCTEEITMYSEATSGAAGCSGQHYLFWPTHGGELPSTAAGVGLSVGTNGIAVYEHAGGYLPPLAAYPCDLGTGWNHIAVVYDSDVAKIYLNGDWVRTGLTSTRGTAYAPYQIGLGTTWDSGVTYSYFTGWVDEVRLWNIALTEEQIEDNMYTENPTAAGSTTVTEVYTSDDSFTPPAGITSVEVLVVGGGGAGGGRHGGGGAGGGVVYDSAYSVTPGVGIPVTVGAGGLPTQTNPTEQSVGGNGGYSAFGSITALGGGGGGSYTAAVPTGGGSGGGGGGGQNTAAGLANQEDSGGGTGYGSDGGTGGASTGGGGGGGAGAIGSNAAGADTGGNGGAGKDYSGTFGAVGGASGWFAGGGGGGGQTAGGTGGSGGGGSGGCDTGTAGTANTGGGGGGVRSLDTSIQGKQGGSGIVIVQYEVPGANLVGLWHFNDCSADILDGVMEDSSTYDNDGTLSSPAPECSDSLSRDVTVYTDYIALAVVSAEEPVPTVGPTPTPFSTVVPYKTTGTTSWIAPTGVTSVEVLVVGGGGAGGGATVVYQSGGGGGAGGVRYNANYAVTPGNSYTVTVGFSVYLSLIHI